MATIDVNIVVGRRRASASQIFSGFNIPKISKIPGSLENLNSGAAFVPEALGSQLDGERSHASQLIADFSEFLTEERVVTRETSRETSESGNGGVLVQNLKPDCFTTPGIRRAESSCSYPSVDDTDCDWA